MTFKELEAELIQSSLQEANPLEAWADKYRAKLVEKRAMLEWTPRDQAVVCIICDGKTIELCGCNGYCSVEFAINFIDGELQVLDK